MKHVIFLLLVLFCVTVANGQKIYKLLSDSKIYEIEVRPTACSGDICSDITTLTVNNLKTKKIQVLDAVNTAIQVTNEATTLDVGKNKFIQVTDINFDGLDDLILFNGGNGSRMNLTGIFINNGSSFVKNTTVDYSSYRSILDFHTDKKKKQLIFSYEVGPIMKTRSSYNFQNNKFVLVQENEEWENQSTGEIEVVYKFYRDSKFVSKETIKFGSRQEYESYSLH